MPNKDRDRLASEGSFRLALKDKSRRRRAALARSARAAAGGVALRNDLAPALELVSIPINDLRLHARRLRKSEHEHVREVANAIGALGFCAPLLISKDKLVLDGEIRLEAARLLGMNAVPCVKIDHLSEAEQRLLRLAVNRLSEKGEWNLDQLIVEFEELILVDAPIEIVGFSPAEIDQIMLGDGADGLEQRPLEPDHGSKAVARPGDMFRLGAHRLICGDATDLDTLQRLTEGDEPARLVLTDEPYNVRIAGNVTGGAHREFAMASGEMSDAEFLGFNLAWMKAVLPCLCDGGVLGTFIDWRGYPTVFAAASELGLDPLNLIVWAKTNGGMGSLYRSQHELLPLFKKGTVPHINNVELGKSGRWRSNVWTYPGASSLGSEARRGLQDHPTVKPTALLEDALLDLTNRGDIVIDPFLGSGSTLIAAESTGRVCRGVELDPLYVDVIIRRYEAGTGNQAALAGTGESLVALAARRATDAGPGLNP